MAEIRKHNPKTNLIGELVRDLAGESLRPNEPGGTIPATASTAVQITPAAASASPMIGVLPPNALSWVLTTTPEVAPCSPSDPADLDESGTD